MVNAAFLVGLVIGFAFFAGLRRHFPLYEGLEDALRILRAFSEHDVVAERGLSLLTNLEAACRTLVANQDGEKYRSRQQLVTGLFGQLRPLDPIYQADIVNRQSEQNIFGSAKRRDRSDMPVGDRSGSIDGMQDLDSFRLDQQAQCGAPSVDDISMMPPRLTQDSRGAREGDDWQPQAEDDSFLFDVDV